MLQVGNHCTVFTSWRRVRVFSIRSNTIFVSRGLVAHFLSSCINMLRKSSKFTKGDWYSDFICDSHYRQSRSARSKVSKRANTALLCDPWIVAATLATFGKSEITVSYTATLLNLRQQETKSAGYLLKLL